MKCVNGCECNPPHLLHEIDRLRAELGERDEANFYEYRYKAAISNERLMFTVRDQLVVRAEKAEARLAAVLALCDESQVAQGDGWGRYDNTWVGPRTIRAAATGETK